MVNPVTYEFILLKTQGEGTDNGRRPFDILDQLGVGMTYTDSTNRLSITRVSHSHISVIFNSGLFFDLSWHSFYGNARNVKILKRYVATGESRGIMGSSPFGNCKLLDIKHIM